MSPLFLSLSLSALRVHSIVFGHAFHSLPCTKQTTNSLLSPLCHLAFHRMSLSLYLSPRHTECKMMVFEEETRTRERRRQSVTQNFHLFALSFLVAMCVEIERVRVHLSSLQLQYLICMLINLHTENGSYGERVRRSFLVFSLCVTCDVCLCSRI